MSVIPNEKINEMMEENDLYDGSIKVNTSVDEMPADLTRIELKNTRTLILHGQYKTGDGSTPYRETPEYIENIDRLVKSSTYDHGEGTVTFSELHECVNCEEYIYERWDCPNCDDDLIRNIGPYPRMLYFKEEIKLEQEVESEEDLEKMLLDLEGHAI